MPSRGPPNASCTQEGGPASKGQVPEDLARPPPAVTRRPWEGDRNLLANPLGGQTARPRCPHVWQPELEKQKDTYLPGQGCCTGEDRALEAATAQRAECSEPPPGRAGWIRWGLGQKPLVKRAMG